MPPHEIHTLNLREAIELYRHIDDLPNREKYQRELALVDRFYLLTVLLGRDDAVHPWIYTSCREVEQATDGYLDLWSRGHYKSTVITYAGAIQEILRNPDITIGIFSHTRPIAKAFLRQIKREFEYNERLKALFPDVLWETPNKESPQWSEDGGIVVQRRSNPKEATVEAWGLVDGQPTSKHFGLRIYDDVVTRESVTTPEQVAKTTEALDLSHNLGSKNGRVWYIGTRYSFADTYQTLLSRGTVAARIKPATDDGTMTGKPVFLSIEEWETLKKNATDFTIACQQLQNPIAGSQGMFQREWLRWYEIRPETLNVYILCDPASSKKKGSDATAMAVIGVDQAGNKYLLDGYRHKMNLAERWDNLKNLRKRWAGMPGVQGVHVGYERYGMRSDLEYFEERMQADGIAFEIRELAWPTEGGGSKADRVQRMVPDHKQGRMFLPMKATHETATQRRVRDEGREHLIAKPIKRLDHERRPYDLAEAYVDEFLFFPFALHDDLIDAVSRIYDMDYAPPVILDERFLIPEYAD